MIAGQLASSRTSEPLRSTSTSGLCSAPFAVEFAGRPFRVVRLGDALVAHSTLCPHWLGPLEQAPAPDGSLQCPWHGYRFDLASGRGCGAAAALRLLPAPRVVIGADGRARLEASTFEIDARMRA